MGNFEKIQLSLPAKFLLTVNRLVPRPRHPFNMAASGVGTYEDWQFEKAPQSLSCFRNFTSVEEMLGNKTVLDLGCGAGGKTVYFAAAGAAKSVGIDIVPHYAEEGRAFSLRKGLADKTEFITGDASNMPFADGTFDSIITNDVMEHLPNPEATLRDASRVLAAGGRLYISFPPYWHPFGAHLSDAIGIPWVHRFFSEDTLGKAYVNLVKDLPNGSQRLDLRFGDNYQEGPLRITYINHMTIKRFRNIIKSLPLNIVYYEQIPLRSFLKPCAAILPEYFTRLVVCVLEKNRQ